MAYFGADGPVRPVDATPPAACWVPPSVADTGVLPLLHLPPGGTKGRQKKVLAVEPGPPRLARPRGPAGEMWVQQHQAGFTGLRRAHRLVQQRQLLAPPHEALGRHLSHSTAPAAESEVAPRTSGRSAGTGLRPRLGPVDHQEGQPP